MHVNIVDKRTKKTESVNIGRKIGKTFPRTSHTASSLTSHMITERKKINKKEGTVQRTAIETEIKEHHIGMT